MPERLPTDEELYSAVKSGDRKAFNQLYDRYWETMYKKAYSYLHDTEAAGEIVNDIFLNIWLKRDQLQIITFQNYLLASARYRVYNQLKAKKRQPLLYIENYDELPNTPVVAMREETLLSSELNQQVNRLLDHLPKRCREIFLLSRVNHLSNAEIAEKLAISKRSVENQLSVAVKHLRSNLGSAVSLTLLLDLIFRLTRP